MRRDGEIHRGCRIHQRVHQQQRRVAIQKLALRQRGVAQAKAQRIIGIGREHGSIGGRSGDDGCVGQGRTSSGSSRSRTRHGALRGLVPRQLALAQLPEDGSSHEEQQADDEPGSRSELHNVLNHKILRLRQGFCGPTRGRPVTNPNPFHPLKSLHARARPSSSRPYSTGMMLKLSTTACGRA